MRNIKTAAWVLILFTIVVKFGLIIMATGFPLIDEAKLFDSFVHSQYNLGKGVEYRGMMADKELYAYVALEYIRGTDPGSLNFEHPPLGKYLLGFSHLFLGNIMAVQYLASAGALGLTWLIGRRLKLSPIMSLVGPAILVFDPLFSEYSSFVHLDLIHLFFITLCLYLLLSRQYFSHNNLWLGLAIGAVLASKAMFNGLLVFFFFLLVDWLEKRKLRPRQYLRVGLISLFVYCLSYTGFFLKHNLLDFGLLQIKVLRFFRAYLPDYPWFEIFRILLIGRWRTWFADPPIQPVPYFWLMWPMGFLATIFTLMKNRAELMMKLKRGETLLVIWVGLYLLFASTHLVFPNYLLPILPAMYVLSAVVLNKAWQGMAGKKQT